MLPPALHDGIENLRYPSQWSMPKPSMIHNTFTFSNVDQSSERWPQSPGVHKQVNQRNA